MPLPTFIVIGAPKAATTSMWRYLGQHPDVFMSPVKEPQYFAFADGPPRYAGPSPGWTSTVTSFEGYAALFAGAGTARAVGEASPVYLVHPDAPSRMAGLLPELRLVAILRNPIERAYSSYRYARGLGIEPLDRFEAALDAEEERLASGWAPPFGYRRNGLYLGHLHRYLDHFPRDRLKVVLYDDLEHDAPAVLAEVFAFVGVDPSFPVDTSRRWNHGLPEDASRLSRFLLLDSPLKTRLLRVVPERLERAAVARVVRSGSPSPVAEETRAELAAGFADDVRGLGELIGRDLSAWLEPPRASVPSVGTAASTPRSQPARG